MTTGDNPHSENPYQALPPVEAQVIRPVDKPTSLVVFGILNLVYGSFTLMGIIASLIIGMLNLPQDPSNPFQRLIEDSGFQSIAMVAQFLNLGLAVLLLASGIGLLNGQVWGRTTAITWSVISLVMVAAGIVVNILYIVIPGLDMINEMADSPAKAVFTFTLIGSAAGGLCSFIYPTLLLIFVNRAPIVNYLAAQR